jgi:ATP-dependent protease ClpP protease subunit
MQQPQPPQAAPAGPQQVPATVYVVFSAEINVKTVESLLAVMANCATQGVKTVYMAISTPGGDVAPGLTLYNVLRAMPFELITHNTGNVDSIGNAVFLAGSKRYACANATFMYHGVGFNMDNQKVRLEEKNVREMLLTIANNHAQIGSVLKDRTKLDQAVIKKLFREAQTKDATFAVNNGIVHDVRDFQIPTGSTVVSLVFQR